MHQEAGSQQGTGIIRVILTADNHLSAYTPKLSVPKLAERRKRLGTAFKQTVDAAIERQADLFIQAGDLFDSLDPRNRERDFVAEQLSRLQAAGIHAFGVSGNHDTPRQKTEQGGFAPQSLYGKLKGMHFFSSSDQIRPVLLEIAGIQVALAGLSYHPHVPPGGDPFDQAQIVDPEGVLERAQVGILILHTAIEGHAFPGQMEIFARRDSLAHLADFQIVLAGHVHAYDRFSIGDKTVVVCGATERMEFGQDEEHVGFVSLEITSEGLLHSEHVPIEPQPRHLLRLRTAELWSHHEAMQEEQTDDLPADEEKRFFQTESPGISVTERIWQQVEPLCTEDAMVRVTLEGPLTREQYHELDLRALWQQGQQRAFSFEVDESRLTLISERSQGQIERGDRIAPRDMLEGIASEWMEQTTTPAERVLLQKMRARVLDRYEELVGRETAR